MMHFAQSTRAVLLALMLAAIPALAEPLDNEQLLALRTAEHVAERALSGTAGLHNQLNDVFQLMSPVLDRPLPASHHVWLALGRWAAAANDRAAGAVTLAGLRREIPDFMSDPELAAVAARLNANRRTRDLASDAAELLDAGATPAAAIQSLKVQLAWASLRTRATRITEPESAFVTWSALAAAYESAGVTDHASHARERAAEHRQALGQGEHAARALLDAAEIQIHFHDRSAAVDTLHEALNAARSLPNDAQSDLLVDAGRLLARAGEFDQAARIAESLPRASAARVWLETARVHARAGDLEAAESSATAVTAPEWRELADVAIVEALARNERIADALVIAEDISDRSVRAEALALLSLFDEEHDLGQAAEALISTLDQHDPVRIAARMRIVGHAARLAPTTADTSNQFLLLQDELSRASPVALEDLQALLKETIVATTLAGRTGEAYMFNRYGNPLDREAISIIGEAANTVYQAAD